MTKREMTIEEAIEIFKEVREEVLAKETELSKQVFENLGIKAVDLAIKVLEQQPCEDCISRTELLARIDAERKHLLDIKMDGAEHIIVHHARRIIEDMPSVTPKVDSEWGSIGNNTDLETVPNNLQDWLSTFNTDSATECFTVVQRLKERVNE